MPQPFRITATNKSTGASESLKGEFPDEHWEPLLGFFHAYQRLAKCRLATERDLGFSLKYEVGEPVEVATTLPPEDDIDAFLLRMRPFVLEREPTSFYRVRNILARYFDIPSARAMLDTLKDAYSGKHIEFEIAVGDNSLTAPEAVDLWLNAYDYHLDTDKRAALDSMFRVFPASTARALFLYAMLERAAAVEKLARLIEGIIKNPSQPSQGEIDADAT